MLGNVLGIRGEVIKTDKRFLPCLSLLLWGWWYRSKPCRYLWEECSGNSNASEVCLKRKAPEANISRAEWKSWGEQRRCNQEQQAGLHKTLQSVLRMLAVTLSELRKHERVWSTRVTGCDLHFSKAPFFRAPPVHSLLWRHPLVLFFKLETLLSSTPTIASIPHSETGPW